MAAWSCLVPLNGKCCLTSFQRLKLSLLTTTLISNIKKNLGPRDEPPPKFLVFFNSRAEAQAGAEYLWACLSPELRDKVKWFHSRMTGEFCEEEIHALIIGESFGEGSTDAAGMVSLLALRLL